MRANARLEDKGWRLDYFIVNKELVDRVKKAKIKDKVYGSDHCPIELEIEVWLIAGLIDKLRIIKLLMFSIFSFFICLLNSKNL